MAEVTYLDKPYVERIEVDVKNQMILFSIRDGVSLKQKHYSPEVLAELLLQNEMIVSD